jgi:hypothetical protein
VTTPEPPRTRYHFGLPSGPGSRPAPFGVAGAVAGLALIAIVLGGLVWSAAAGRPAVAQRPTLFEGSLVLADARPLTVINVATAEISVRLQGVNAQVGAPNDADVQPVPVEGGTVLVNRLTGSFNFLEEDDYVTAPNGPGVGLGLLPGLIGAAGYGAGRDAYIVRSATSSTVSRVDNSTVAAAARAEAAGPATPGRGVTAAPAAAVRPLGFNDLGGPVTLAPGSAVVSGRDLWVMVGRGFGCRVVQLSPTGSGHQGLVPTDRTSFDQPCTSGALENAGGGAGLATPGRVQIFGPGATSVVTKFTAGATRILPVTGTSTELWFLFDQPSGWSMFGVAAGGRVVGPFSLSGLGTTADPVAPVLSAGFLYTLDQQQAGQPTLWTVDIANGHMAPLRDTPQYPELNASEQDDFRGAEALVDGPRVVFNNPQSLEAVVVFTDRARSPVVIDKSRAVAVSTTGPADLNAGQPGAQPAGDDRNGSPTTEPRAPVPVVQPVSQKVACATTTQKPYVPQITAVTPASGAALVAWSYELLDQTDCEPDSWSVSVRAISGSHQPADPQRTVYGQEQLLFTGLRPATQYEVTVTAYINQQFTTSPPATFATSPRGPDAPLNVRTTADGHGDWVVSWTPCTEAANANCVVPADEWTVTGAACAGSFVGTPPSVQVAGTQDTATISAANLGLLGDHLAFSVQGSLVSGLTGDPTSDRSCTEGWQPPNPSHITVTGAGAPQPDGTVTATIQVETSGDSSAAFGSPPTETQFVYHAGGVSYGPTSQTQASIPGLPPGVPITPSVLVYPAGHPEAAVTVTGTAFARTLPWPPDLSSGGTAIAGQVVAAYPNSGTFTVSFPADLPNGPLQAITPDPSTGTGPAYGGVLQCGGSGGAPLQFPVQAVDTDHQLTFALTASSAGSGGLVDHGGECAFRFTLSDTQDPDPYGSPSPVIEADFTIGTQPAYSFTSQFVGDCTTNFRCGPLGEPYQLGVNSSAAFAGGGGWTVEASDSDYPRGADPCSTGVLALPTPPTFPYTVTLPGSCVNPQRVNVTVSYTYLGEQQAVRTGYPANGPGSPATTVPAPTTTTTSSTSTTSTTTPTSSVPTTTSSVPATAAPGPGQASSGPGPAPLAAWSFGPVALAGAARAGRRARWRPKSRNGSR